MLVYYLDNFVEVFTTVQALAYQRRNIYQTYNWVIDFLGIPKNDWKNVEKAQVIVVKIEIHTISFIARFPKERLDKTIKITEKIPVENSAIFLNIQSLVGCLSILLTSTTTRNGI